MLRPLALISPFLLILNPNFLFVFCSLLINIIIYEKDAALLRRSGVLATDTVMACGIR